MCLAAQSGKVAAKSVVHDTCVSRPEKNQHVDVEVKLLAQLREQIRDLIQNPEYFKIYSYQPL